MLSHHVSHRVVELFAAHVLLLWLFSLLIVVALGLFLSNHRHPMFPSRSCEGRWNSLTKLKGPNFTDGISIIVFLIFLAFYIRLIFYKEDFAYYDDEILTDFSVQGRNFLPPVWSALGRFYPLADQEFNLLKFITRSPAGYHALVALQLLVLVAVLFRCIARIPGSLSRFNRSRGNGRAKFPDPLHGLRLPRAKCSFLVGRDVVVLASVFQDEGAHLFCGLPRGRAFRSLL